MTNLQTFDNLYASLSQSAYEDRPYNFVDLINETMSNETYVMMTYSNTITDKSDTIFGGQNLPNSGVLYVHKDTTVQTFREHASVDETIEYKTGLMTNEIAGFNSYFLTDTPQLNTDTKNAYIAVKGSDGPGLHSIDDWIGNNAPFDLSNLGVI